MFRRKKDLIKVDNLQVVLVSVVVCLDFQSKLMFWLSQNLLFGNFEAS